MIEIESITLSYNQQTVLQEFSLSIENGAKVAICGTSGCGKSSILRCLLGFARPERGKIIVNGTELDGQTVWQIRKLIGYVAQEPQLGEGQVREIIERPLHYKANREIAYNINKLGGLFAEFDLKESVLSKNIASLSGGEKQRVALITALLLERQILLLDEISSALDPKSRGKVLEHIFQTDKTVVFVSHDPVVISSCDRVVTLDGDGQGGRQ